MTKRIWSNTRKKHNSEYVANFVAFVVYLGCSQSENQLGAHRL